MSVFIKLSGDCFSDNEDSSAVYIHDIAHSVKQLYDAGQKVYLLNGGGNICRGRDKQFPKPYVDYIGMYGTVVNSIKLFCILREYGIQTRLVSDIVHSPIFSRYCKEEVDAYPGVVVFGGGCGIPFISTDTAAVIKGVELSCKYIVKLTNVDGIYSSDPRINSDALWLRQLNYKTCIENGYQAIDMCALNLASENDIEILVANVSKSRNLHEIINNKTDCTVISNNV